MSLRFDPILGKLVTDFGSAAVGQHEAKNGAHTPAKVGADPAGAATTQVGAHETAFEHGTEAVLDHGSKSGPLAIDCAEGKKVQRVSLSGDLTLTEGTGWPTVAGAKDAQVRIEYVLNGHAITWTAVSKWLTSAPAGESASGRNIVVLVGQAGALRGKFAGGDAS